MLPIPHGGFNLFLTFRILNPRRSPPEEAVAFNIALGGKYLTSMNHRNIHSE